MSIEPILHPLSGEQVLALAPPDAAGARATWLRRPNLFPGRALTAPTLQARSAWAAGHVALRGQGFSAGVVRGLEAGFDIRPALAEGARPRVRWEIAAGQGLSASGETVSVAAMSADFWSLPVVGPSALWGEEDADDEGFAEGELQRRKVGPTVGELLAKDPAMLPRAGVLVLQPVRVDQDRFDPDDPCDQCACGDGNVDYADRRFVDAARLLWYAWPEDWQAAPPPGDAFRNRLAWTVFDRERELPAGGLLPWEAWGVPVAMVGVDAAFLPVFADHSAVARRGGRGRHHRLHLDAGGQVVPGHRQAALWQAQIEQLAEHLASLGDSVTDAAGLARHFDRLPPCGLLPREALDPGMSQSGFFPDGMDLDAVPVPLEQLDLAIRESAGLAPLDLARGERVRVLVPVSQASFDPHLLDPPLQIAQEFLDTLDQFLHDRADALAARHGLRLKGAVLAHALRGDTPEVPALDADPQALEPEDLSLWGPPPGQGGHRVDATARVAAYGFEGASATSKPNPGGVLYSWVYLDPQQPPQAVMLEWTDGAGTRRAYWGDALFERGKEGSPEQLRIDNLPPAGRWVRLEVDVAKLEAGAMTLAGMGFVVAGGRAAFAASGQATGDKDVPWFDVALPKDAKPTGEPFDFIPRSALLAPTEPDLGVSAHDDAPQDWPDGASTALQQLGDDARLTGLLSDSEQAQLAVRGIDGFIAYLKDRADRADDLVDYGFVKVQTDIYRIRQLMLDTTEATRLAVSPALAGIAQAETAVATQERLSSFFTDLRKNDSMTPPKKDPATGGSGGGTLTGGLKYDLLVKEIKPQSTLDYLGTMFVTPASEPPKQLDVPLKVLKYNVAPKIVREGRVGARAGATAKAAPAAASASGFKVSALEALTPKAGIDLGTAATARINLGPSQLERLQTGIVPLAVVPPVHTVLDVVNASPLIGNAHVRTMSIAERLKPPRAEEARDYATSTRHEAVQGLLRLADQLVAQDGEVPGLFEDIDVWGLAGDDFGSSAGGTDTKPPKLKLTAFIAATARPALMTALLRPPMRSNADEASYFSDSADMADRTIALFRQVEGRVKRYRDAIAACEQARLALVDHIGALAARERAAGERLAEARHDVSVARALIAEEEARLAAINAHRAAVLAKEVRFLAYVRPRAVDNLAKAMSRPLDPGLLEAAVPGCLQEHADVPDELDAMLAVLREAPADWFRHAPELLDRLGRTDLLLRVLQTAQLRTQLAQQRPALAVQAVQVAQPLQVTRVAAAVGQVRTAQLQTVAVARDAVLRLDPALLASTTWQGVRTQAAKVVSLSDLIDGDHGQARVARDAAALFDRFGHICGCLHAGFSGVLPSIRLDWAETLSQFDQAPSLRNLASLPRWSEIAHVERRRMQALVDWLFDQVEAGEARAQSLANDLVRMCLLLASHAPVGRIIAGRLPRPTLVRPGLRIPLLALEPARVRIGMQALLYRGDQVVATARVEDLGSGEVSARVVQAQGGGLELDTGVRVQFAEMASVSLSLPVATLAKVRG